MKLQYIMFIVLCGWLILFNMFAQDTLTYTVKKGDTLESIAIEVYGNLPYSESEPFDNRFRSILIFNENKKRLGLSITFEDYDWNPVVKLEPNWELIIPVCTQGYPGKPELKHMLEKEMIAVKLEIRSGNEAVQLEKIKNSTTDNVRKIIFAGNENNDYILEQVFYEKTPYPLSDGAVLPQLHSARYNFFVWQIIEHPDAKKTVFLFPDTGINLDGAVSKLLIMNEIADANYNKQLVVLLELLDNVNDKNLISRFYDLRGKKTDCDFSRIVSSPCAETSNNEKTRAAMSCSMALFYQNSAIKVSGAEDSNEIEEYVDRKGGVEKEIEENYRKYRQAQLKEFYEFYYLRTELFLRRIEDDIIDSALKRGITDAKRASQINSLQLEFARLFLSEEYLDILLAKYEDKRIEKILSAIDEICGSHTITRYNLYKQDIMQSWETHASAEVLKQLDDYKQKLLREGKAELLLKRDEIIAGSFAALEDGAVGICELGVDHVYNQIELCMMNKEYNLVVFYHPGINALDRNYPQAQNPQMHEQVMAQNRLADSYFNELKLPDGFEAATEAEVKQLRFLREKYILFRALPVENDILNQKKSVIEIRRIPSQGELVRLATSAADGTISQAYYFFPKKNNEESDKSYAELFSATDITEQGKKLLRKFTELSNAAKDL
ncbi:MAG: hypothetical protein JW822_09975 [Spirochaetales bacterium]|nr:hypothetical protein [Spirochaetales bacterium]